jgi:hypothetical protein
MHGLQSVAASLGKRIRCLSTCPPGTPGRILCRRLAHSHSSAASSLASQFQPPLDAEAVLSLSTAATNALRRLQDVLDQAVREFETSKESKTKTTATQPLKGPLDSALTGLRSIPAPNPETPIGGLLYAIDQKQGPVIWDKFKHADRLFLLRHLSHHQFSALLRSLQPDDFLRLKERHRLDENGNAIVISEEKAFGEFSAKLALVIKIMRQIGYRLTARDYQHLIDCARTGGDVKLADSFWNNMAGAGDVQLDTWVYNSFLAAIVGPPTYEREFRVGEAILQHRAQRKSDDPRKRAQRLFGRMTEKGIVPSSMTFDIIMLAMARMGDIAGVETTLKRVWGVDVRALPDEDAVNDKRIAMRKDSPIYPTNHTLVAVSTAFCQNGQIDVAVRVVDHLSRRYDIPIPVPAWVTIMNWTYVLLRHRNETRVPLTALESVWKIMTAEPYNVVPTADMYDYIIRNYLWRRMPGAAEEIMDSAAISLFQGVVKRAFEIEQRIIHGKIIRGMPKAEERPDEVGDAVRNMEKLKRDVSTVLRTDRRIRSMMQRWVELLVNGKDVEVTNFGPQEVPRIINKWECFLGNHMIYRLRTGYVELNLGKEELLPEPIINRKRRWYLTLLGTGAKEEDDFF